MTFLETAWHEKAGWLIILWPISVLFRLLALCRRRLQQISSRPSHINVPIVVVGNISVGGTGKTSVVIALAKNLKSLGINPGIISRGYGGSAAAYPLIVNSDCEVSACGDEALLTPTFRNLTSARTQPSHYYTRFCKKPTCHR